MGFEWIEIKLKLVYAADFPKLALSIQGVTEIIQELELNRVLTTWFSSSSCIISVTVLSCIISVTKLLSLIQTIPTTVL